MAPRRARERATAHGAGRGAGGLRRRPRLRPGPRPSSPQPARSSSLALTTALLWSNRGPGRLAWALAGSLALAGLPQLLASSGCCRPRHRPTSRRDGSIRGWKPTLTPRRFPTGQSRPRFLSSSGAPLRSCGPSPRFAWAWDTPSTSTRTEPTPTRIARSERPWRRSPGRTAPRSCASPASPPSWPTRHCPNPYRELSVLNASLAVRAYTLPGAAPGVRLATRVFQAADLAAVMAVHRSAGVRPEVRRGPRGGAATSPASAATRGELLESDEQASHLVAEIETPSDAVLVWTRTYFSAWQATVDGVNVRPMRADGHLVGIPVARGRHHVEVTWQPGPVRIGLGLCLAGCLTALALRRV